MANAPTTLAAMWDGVCPFDEVIDVRSPGEFAEDRVPAAVNLPVLSDDERAEVGTLHADAGGFPARRLGAGLVSANIARHLAGHLAAKPREYRPLVYCWRGGQRSASLATVLAAVGWRVTVLKGGYKTYRADVRARLATVPAAFTYRVVGGATGTGKTRLLHALAARGGQVLDLEGLANHRGSALGVVGPQPSQKLFESELLGTLRAFDPATPVWVEAESNRIGDLYLPAALWEALKRSGGVELQVPLAGRVDNLVATYTHFVADPAKLAAALAPFAAWHGQRRIDAWNALAAAGRWAEFVADLLKVHYDPRYAASARKSFPNVTTPAELPDTSAAALDRLAAELLAAG